MAKKIEINENWEQIEVEDLDNLFVVIFKHGSFDQGYIEAFDTDDILMQSAYDNLSSQYAETDCDDLTKIYLIKVPNTDQTTNLCANGLFNGNCCDPHVIEAVKDLYNRADVEQLACWEGCGLTEAKKKKKYPAYASSLTYTTGDPDLNIKHFNKMMGTAGLGSDPHPHLVVGDTLPNSAQTIANLSSGESPGGESSGSETSGGESGSMGESLTEAKEESLENKLREILATKEDHLNGKPHLFETNKQDEYWVEHFGEEAVDFNNLKVYERTPEEKANGMYIATFMISGGKNGSGEWKDYLQYLADAFKEIEEKTNAKPLLYKLDTDILDDVWTGYIFLYDHEDKVQESLNEDLIVIEPEEEKEKIEDLKAQIEACDNPKVRKSLLTLMNIYLFQTYKPSDRENSTLTDDEWQEIADWHKEETTEEEEQPMEEQLNEAHLDYPTQLAKMKALENRTRGFNAASASDEKLEYNWKLCKSEGLSYAQSVMEQEMLRRGGRLADLVMKSRKTKVKITDYEYILDPGYINSAAVNTVWHSKDKPQELINYYGSAISEILMVLVIALLMGEKGLADAVKDHILNKFTITLQELKDFLNKGFANKAFVANLKQTIKTTCTESLEEDTAYSHKMEDKFEVPPQIKLLDQKQVEDFIKQLAPEELFRIGYATPLYFYSELDDKFDLVKATEMEGYTGLDYRDASVNATDHDERVANAQRQIDTYADVLDKNQGHKLNTGGERFSTTYRATNKLALNPEKSNEYIEYELDDEGKPKLDDKGEKVIKSKIDMNKILFYPRVGSQPLTHYYIDFHNGQGFKPIKREVLVDTLYKFIMEVEKANAQGVSKSDLMWLQKKGYGKNVKKDSQQAIDAFYAANGKDIPIWAYRKAEEAGLDPKEYYKEHPFSTRWGMRDFRKKATSLFDADAATIMAQDASTVAGKELAATTGANRTVSGSEAKPQVRALYSNQVYFLDGKPGKFGAMLHEGLEENASFDPDDYLLRVDSDSVNIFDLKSGETVGYIDDEGNAHYNAPYNKILKEEVLDEAKRYVKRYYVRPQNIFCSNKEDILQALLRVGDENCSIYSLKNLPDHNDVHLLKPSDIIYYYDDHVLYDKNHVQVMDYDLFVKHEEDRKKVANVDAMSDAAFADEYEDRITDDDLKDKEVIANYKAINAGEFKEELELTEGTDFNGFFTFDDNQEEIDFNTKWAKNLNGENERIPGVAGSEVQVWIKQDNNRYAKRPGYFKFIKMFLNTKGVPYIKIAKLGQEDQELSYKFMAFFKPQSFNNNPDKLYYLTAGGTLKSRLEIYLEDKKNIKAQKRTAAYQGARSVQSLSEEEQKLALDWFSENIVSIDIKYPTGTPNYTQEEGALDSKNPTVKKCAEKFARLDAKFHRDFGVDKNTTEGYLDTAKKVHFSARDASEIQEKTVEYYNRWGLSCLITFKETLGNANDIVLGLIAQAKKDSIEAKNDVNEFKLEDRSVDSIFLCYAIKELVDDDWNKLSEIAAPDGGENPFNQDFAEPTDESLRENKEEEKCCICGEPINGYGNNPEPYKHEGRCCDACNLKFVIPARLAAVGNKEEE